MYKDSTLVLCTTDREIRLVAFNERQERVGSWLLPTRRDALNTIEHITGRKVKQLRPMQTIGAEKVEVMQELSDVGMDD